MENEGKEERILVIDDDLLVGKSIKTVLTVFKYDAQVIFDGFLAVQYMQTNPNDIDLVILDMMMPGLSGEEIYKIIQQINPKIKVLVTSGYSEGEAKNLFPGSAGFIQKPYAARDLVKRVREILDARN